MAKVESGRRMGQLDGDFVVFLIGARLDPKHPLRSFRDLGGRRGMRHMLDYLVAHPERGLLGYQMGLPTIVQYWRSFEQLEAFARVDRVPHLWAWRNWSRVDKQSHAGIWHETFLVRAGEYEAICANMPPHELAKAGRSVPMGKNSRARVRLNRPVS
jgi:hypothetical protein